MERKGLIWAGIHGFSSVAMGAFAAHALKARLDPEHLALIDTGARYQMFGALALLAMAAWTTRPRAPFWCLSLGTLIFSGSLYGLAFGAARSWGVLTPIGGLLMLGGWLGILLQGLKKA